MLTPRLTNCKDCCDISQLIKEIDCKLAEYSNILYNNIILMLNKPIPSEDMFALIAYKRILMFKYTNSEYACKYTLKEISSRVKSLTMGCKPKCTNKVITTTTTTTTINYISFFGRVGTAVCVDGFKTVLSDSTSENYKSSQEVSLNTILFYSDYTPIINKLVLNYEDENLLTTDSLGKVILIEINDSVPC